MNQRVHERIHKAAPYVSYANLLALLALITMIVFGLTGSLSSLYARADAPSASIDQRMTAAETDIRNIKKTDERLEREIRDARALNNQQYRDLNDKLDQILLMLSNRGRGTQ